jgi:hypothetical protein
MHVSQAQRSINTSLECSLGLGFKVRELLIHKSFFSLYFSPQQPTYMISLLFAIFHARAQQYLFHVPQAIPSSQVINRHFYYLSC